MDFPSMRACWLWSPTVSRRNPIPSTRPCGSIHALSSPDTGASRNVKYRAGRDEFLSKLLAGGVDELQETVHNELVGFCGHSAIYSISFFMTGENSLLTSTLQSGAGETRFELGVRNENAWVI